jgi:hypothetical protein
MARKSYQDTELRKYPVESFSKGYNSYTLSNTLVDDQEFPQGQNVYLDNNGAVAKAVGSSRFTTNEVSTGHAIFGMGWLKNPSNNKVIAVSNTAWYRIDSGTPAALTGLSFTADKDTDFCQAIDRLYGANGTDKLAWTDDGSTITEVSSNGNIGRWPVSYNRRIYMTNTTAPDRIYFSNPYGIDATTNPPTYSTTYFGTFDTDLSTTIAGGNKKNAGFIILLPGGGVEITGLKLDNYAGSDYIYAATKHHGTWRIGYSSTNTDGTIVHTITQIDTTIGSPSGRSLVKIGNDIGFYGRDNFYRLGEVAQYANLRVSPKGGRVQNELNSVSTSLIGKVASVLFMNKVHWAYGVGTYNDRILIEDIVLNAWSAPRVGINASCFLVWEDDNGQQYLLSGSSNSADSRIYQLATGTNDASTAISANFTTKSYDCKLPGLIKRFAFIDVFYSLVYGVLTYEVFVDETSSITGALQLGSSASSITGIGSKLIGTFLIGTEFAGTAPSINKFNNFRIPCSYTPGKNISVKFTNNNTGESFRINSMIIYYDPGDIYEQG